MSELVIANKEDLVAVADAIREKTGSTDELSLTSMANVVSALKTEIPQTLPNPKKLIFTGAVTAEYDGSEEQTINIPESSGGGMTEEQISLLNGKIDSPQTAEVGQVLSVKAVDENGKPTEWEVVDVYQKTVIDNIMGSYIADIDTLIGEVEE